MMCAADLYEKVFEGDPMSQVRGKDYRKNFLEYGGSQPEMDTVRNFLGREPNSEAYCQMITRRTR